MNRLGPFFPGAPGFGTVFAINTDGGGFTTLYSFNGTHSDGALPQASLILSGNTLYGTTSAGGSSGTGSVFAINTDGAGFTTLHRFTGATHCMARRVLAEVLLD